MVLNELLIAGQLLNLDSTALEKKVIEPTVIEVSDSKSNEVDEKTISFENALDHQFRYYQNLQGEKGIVEAWFKVDVHNNITLQNFIRFKEGGYFGRVWIYFNSNDLLKDSENSFRIRNKNTFVNDNELFTSYLSGINLLYFGEIIPGTKVKGAITGSFFPAVFSKNGRVKGVTAADFGGRINLPFGFYGQGYAVFLFNKKENGIKLGFSNSEIGFYKNFKFETFDLDLGYRIDNGFHAYNDPKGLYHSILLQVSNLLKRK